MSRRPKSEAVAQSSYERVFVRWPDDKKGPFVLEAKWAEESGRPVCIGLTVWKGVEPQEDPLLFDRIDPSATIEGLGGTDLRSIPLASVLERLWLAQQERETSLRRAWGDMAQSELADDRMRESVARMLATPHPYEGNGPRRRQADDVEHFTAVAAVYEAAMAAPGRKRPTEAVKNHFNVSHSTATKWVHHARDILHLLPPTTPGKPTATDQTKMRPKKGAR